MKHIKNRKDFLNESLTKTISERIEKIRELARKIRSDIQLDRGSADFMGFLNLDPSEPWDGNWKQLLDAFFEMYEHDKTHLIMLLSEYGLEIESAHETELIIREIRDFYKEWHVDQFLEHIGCELTDNGWNCKSVIASGNATPLTKDGKLTVQFNELSGVFDVNNCGLTSLEGAPRKAEYGYVSQGNKLPDGVLNWYIHIMQKKEGYQDYWISLLMYVLNNHPQEVQKIDWPEGFLDEHLEKSAKALGKYNI